MSNTARTQAKPAAPVTLELGADLSPAVEALEKAYRMIQRRYADAPNVTIVVKRDERAWGHTTVAKTWSAASHDGEADRFEVMISGENLRRGAVAVAGTLLHEAAHARNLAAGVLDTDVNGRHNQKFADVAREHGLTVEAAGWHGFAKTELPEAGAASWKAMIKTLEAGLRKSAATAQPSVAHLGDDAVAILTGGAKGTVAPVGTKGRIGIATPPRRTGNRNLIKAVCGCGKSLRASAGVLAACRPTCQECGQEFTA